MRLSKALIPILCTLTLVGSAQAYEWTIEEEQLTSFGVSKETTSGAGGAFELAVPALGMKLQCKSLSSVGEIAEAGKSSASISLSGCVVDEAEETCAVQSPGKSTGVLAASVTTKFLTVEVKGTPSYYDEVTLAMTVDISGELCPLEMTEVSVKGTTAAEVPSPGEEAAERPRTFSQAIEEKSGVAGLTFGIQKAFLSGKYAEELSGTLKQQQMGMTTLTISPAPVAFAGTGGGNSKQVTIKNNSQRNVDIEDVGITGPYGLTNTSNCIGKTLLVPPNNPNMCTVTVTCNEAGKPAGYFLAIWNIGQGPKFTRARMTC